MKAETPGEMFGLGALPGGEARRLSGDAEGARAQDLRGDQRDIRAVNAARESDNHTLHLS